MAYQRTGSCPPPLNRLLLLGVALLAGLSTKAQPTWRFHLAFEDGSGARDTVWFVFDTSATDEGVDFGLGEGPVTMDLDAFNVWMPNWDGDSTKTFALPYSPYFPAHGAYVEAFNCVFPVTLRWDTALFHASTLPNPAAIQIAKMDCGHFFLYNNDPGLQAYNMLLDDSVTVALLFPNDFLFPLSVYIDGDAHASATNYTRSISNELVVWPNPTNGRTEWVCKEPLCETLILDASCRVVCAFLDQQEVDLSMLAPGAYMMKAIGQSKQYSMQ
ncbi:MAG: hypothetical protein IPL52_14930 [Flavobacteriales bacterium]|nr:hypothetical protein [Flavobacteriales bacterium]